MTLSDDEFINGQIPCSHALELNEILSPSDRAVPICEVYFIFIISIIGVTLFITQDWLYGERTAPGLCCPIAHGHITASATRVT